MRKEFVSGSTFFIKLKYYLPPSRELTKDFWKLLFKDEKKAIKIHEITSAVMVLSRCVSRERSASKLKTF